MIKKIAVLLLIPISARANTDDFNQILNGKTFLLPRSQCVNAARELAGFHRYINLYDEGFYGAFSITPEYGESFRPNRIAEYYFAVDTFTVTGSQVMNRSNPNDMLADYFGLSPLFQSTVHMVPKIKTALVDLDLYLGYCDYYLRAHVPAVWTKWTFHLNEEIAPLSNVNATYPPLYMSQGAIAAPAQTFKQAIAGNITWGDIKQGLQYGTIGRSQRKSGFTEIQIALGYNFINNPIAHAGFNIRGSIPGGTRTNPAFLFDPVIGNGHHGELGAGFTGHLILWEMDGIQQIAIFTDINTTHLFHSRQRRSFDLLNPNDPTNQLDKGFGSRYILAKEFNNLGNYTGNSLFTIDATTLECDISVALQIDAVIMASYMDPNYTFDLGYNVWFRSREMISNRESISFNRYALKGIQNVALPGGARSNATQSTATLEGNEYVQQAAVADPNPPVFFNDANINNSSAEATRGFTHKVFSNLQYAWCGCNRYVDPFIGIGFEVEFEGLNPRHYIKANKNSISQWGVWAKGGFGF